MKHVYKLAFILVIGAGFALAQAGAGSQSSPPPQQPGAQQPDTQPPQSPTNPSSSSPGANPDTSANSGDVQSNIQKAIQQDPSLASSNVNVNVSNNKVELTGTVASKDQKKTARQIAETNAGGMKVVDHLKVSSTEATPSTPSTPPKN